MMTMNDKNGIRIHVGDIVNITNGYFKSDNGLFMVVYEPNVFPWTGKRLCLCKVTKCFKPSKKRLSTAFWPLMPTVTSWFKRESAKIHNNEKAVIEIVGKVTQADVDACLNDRY